MKVLNCTLCGTIRSAQGQKWTSCDCGNVEARWLSDNYTLEIRARYREAARVIGFHNTFLNGTRADPPLDDKGWRSLLRRVVTTSPGHMFNRDQRNCPMVIIKPGEHITTKWADRELGVPDE
jgi:hypothetical protein